MKHTAWPGTFLLAALPGFLPGTVLMWAALQRLWSERTDQLQRFLLAWIIGYFVYLELISGKPGTYAVQVVFPAFALAVALWIFHKAPNTSNTPGASSNWLILPPPVAALAAPVFLAIPYIAVREWPPVWLALPVLVLAGMFFASASAGRAANWIQWAALSIAAFSIFSLTIFGGVLPSIDKIWPARQIARALETCPAGTVSVFGFKEPSAKFVLRSDTKLADADTLRDALVSGRNAYLVGEVRDERFAVLNRFQMRRPKSVGCVKALNTVRGCYLYFRILATGDISQCVLHEIISCNESFFREAEIARGNIACK